MNYFVRETYGVFDETQGARVFGFKTKEEAEKYLKEHPSHTNDPKHWFVTELYTLGDY